MIVSAADNGRLFRVVEDGCMSTTVTTQPPNASDGWDWTPPPRSIYRLRVDQYEAMVASGVFTKRDRLHLIDGILVSNLIDRRVEVYTGARPDGYSLCAIYGPGQAVPVVLDGRVVGRIPVEDLLPKQPESPDRGA
jgi:hypothetical protein